MKKLLLSAAILSIVSPSFAMMAGDKDRGEAEKDVSGKVLNIKRVEAPKAGEVEPDPTGAIDAYFPPIKNEQAKQEGLKPMPGVIGF